MPAVATMVDVLRAAAGRYAAVIVRTFPSGAARPRRRPRDQAEAVRGWGRGSSACRRDGVLLPYRGCLCGWRRRWGRR